MAVIMPSFTLKARLMIIVTKLLSSIPKESLVNLFHKVEKDARIRSTSVRKIAVNAFLSSKVMIMTKNPIDI